MLPISAACFTLILTLGSLTACTAQDCGRQLSRLDLTIGHHVLNVEVASTAEERQCGLAQRDVLVENKGMLFVFETERRWEFWMKDTRIPLSIAFLDAQRRITEIIDMTSTNSEQRYRPARPALYALEMPLGWFSDKAIGIGDQASFRLHGHPI